MVAFAGVVQVTATYWPHFLCLILVFCLARNYFKSALVGIPGPFLASLTDFWRLFHAWQGRGHEDYRLHRKYRSPILRVGPNTVAVADPEAVRVIYGWKPVFNKTFIYTTQSQLNTSGDVVENLASIMDEKKHTRLTRPVAGAYAMTTLVEFEPLVDSTSRAFVAQMRDRFINQDKACPLDLWLQMYAFDVIGEITFSKRIGFLDTGKDVDEMMHHTGRFMDYTGIIGQVPWLDWYFRIKNPILHALKPTSNILNFTLKQIREHQSFPASQTRDLLSRFIQARDKFPDIINEDLLNDYANTNVAGGSDTTAIILRALIYQLLTQPGIYAKFLEEIKNVLKARQQENMDAPISWAEGLQMNYYQSCIKEALRYHPATAQILPRFVPAGGVQLCGKFLPEGTVVGCNAWTLHRDKALYGEDADVYRPERWLEATPEHVRKMETLLFTFGGGKRACVGKNIAMLELTKFVPEIFRQIEFELVDPSQYKVTSTWLAVQSGLDVKMRMRAPGSLVDEE